MYRRNIFVPDFGSGIGGEVQKSNEETRFNRLHFGGKLNLEAIRLLAILDVPLAVEILWDQVDEKHYTKRQQLDELDLDKIYEMAPGLDIPMRAAFILNQSSVDPSERMEELFGHMHPVLSVILVAGVISAWRIIPRAGMFLDAYGGHHVPYEDYHQCLHLIEGIESPVSGLRTIAQGLPPGSEEYEYIESLAHFLLTLQAALITTCKPVCPEPDCTEDHDEDRFEIEDIKATLLKYTFRLARISGTYKQFRDSFVDYLLEEFERRT